MFNICVNKKCLVRKKEMISGGNMLVTEISNKFESLRDNLKYNVCLVVYMIILNTTYPIDCHKPA